MTTERERVYMVHDDRESGLVVEVHESERERFVAALETEGFRVCSREEHARARRAAR